MECSTCSARADMRSGELKRFNSWRQVARHMESRHGDSRLMNQIRQEMKMKRSKAGRARSASSRNW